MQIRPLLQPALEVHRGEPRKFGLADFDNKAYTTRKEITLVQVLPSEVIARHLEDETLVNVDSDLTQGGMLAPDDQRVVFNNYFSEKTWVIADAFKGRNLANFTMNQAVEKQAEIAKVPLTGLQQVVIKNIVNRETLEFIEKYEFEHGAKMNQEQLVEFLITTSLGKGACWTVCSKQNSRVPIGATVLKEDGMVIIIQLEALTHDNAGFMERINPYLR